MTEDFEKKALNLSGFAKNDTDKPCNELSSTITGIDRPKVI